MQDSVARRISEVCATSRVGRTKVYEAIKRGELNVRSIALRRRIPLSTAQTIAELVRVVESLFRIG
jgi:hypothetical protein